IQVLAPDRVRFVLKQPWPDFMAFYGTSATGAAWIVPKKYIEKVGEDGFRKAPIGAGPYKVVSVSAGNELKLEAFADYWRKKPAVKYLVMRSIPDESTRAVAVKTGEVDVAYLFGGPVAQDLKRTPGVTIKAPLLYGMYWLDFLDQWDPKSPWHDRRVRLAASLASVRNMERATFMSSWHDKKLRGLLIGATGAAGNAAARLEPFMTKSGLYAYGSLPEVDDLFQRQARELDRGKREALLHQIQKIVTDQVLAAPIFQQGFIWGVGPRVAEP